PAVVLWQIGKPNAPGVYAFILSNTWDWRSLASAPPSVAGRPLLLGTAPARRTLRLVSSHTVPRWRRERLGVSPQAAPAPAWSSPANGSTRPIPHAASLPQRAIPGQQSPARWPRSASGTAAGHPSALAATRFPGSGEPRRSVPPRSDGRSSFALHF